MSFEFLTGEPAEITALAFRTRPALAALAFIVLASILLPAVARWRRRRGAEVDVLSPSVWAPSVVVASLVTDPIGGWGFDVAAARALVFLYAMGQVYLFVMALRWLQRKRA